MPDFKLNFEHGRVKLIRGQEPGRQSDCRPGFPVRLRSIRWQDVRMARSIPVALIFRL